MILADNTNLCEETQVAILSDTELTQKQKNHIESCEECRALLSQTKSMKNDLSTFTVPGLSEGQIADKVMQSIKKQKLSVPFPKFKITHHLGTAAAVAVILVAALIIKNPSETDSSAGISYNNTADDKVITEAHFGTISNFDGTDDIAVEAADEEAVLFGYTGLSDEPQEMSPRPENAPVLKMTKAKPSNGKEEVYTDVAEESQQTESDIANRLTSDKSKLLMSSYRGSGGSGGTQEDSLSYYAANDAAAVYEEAAEQEVAAFTITPEEFESAGFISESSNAFEDNILIANGIFYSKYSVENHFTREMLEDLGITTNELFLKALRNLAEKGLFAV